MARLAGAAYFQLGEFLHQMTGINVLKFMIIQ